MVLSWERLTPPCKKAGKKKRHAKERLFTNPVKAFRERQSCTSKKIENAIRTARNRIRRGLIRRGLCRGDTRFLSRGDSVWFYVFDKIVRAKYYATLPTNEPHRIVAWIVCENIRSKREKDKRLQRFVSVPADSLVCRGS